MIQKTSESLAGSTTLNIGIVGAGLGGLSAAIDLRRAGHQCELFEQSQLGSENGAALSITPNGSRILSRWGVEGQMAHGIPCSQVRRLRGDTLEVTAPTLDFSNIEEMYGARWTFYHRVDMHNHLRELATSKSHAGPAAVIHLGCQVGDVDVDKGSIVLKDGRVIQKDLVIIADGQNDQLNPKITGESVPLERSGQTVYRCLIPMSEVRSDPVTSRVFANQPSGFWSLALSQKGLMCVAYPCRDGELLNCLVVFRQPSHPTNSDERDGGDDSNNNNKTNGETAVDDWNSATSIKQFEAVIEPFHPAIRTLLLKSPEIKKYTQMKRRPLSKLAGARAVLIGDAAHPMLMAHAQGVSSTFEDAAALAVLLSHFHATTTLATDRELARRLQLFETLRLPRISATQIMTDPVIPGPHAATAYKKMEEKIRRYCGEDGDMPPITAAPHSPAICDFFFGYDVVREAEKALLRSLQQEQQ